MKAEYIGSITLSYYTKYIRQQLFVSIKTEKFYRKKYKDKTFLTAKTTYLYLGQTSVPWT